MTLESGDSDIALGKCVLLIELIQCSVKKIEMRKFVEQTLSALFHDSLELTDVWAELKKNQFSTFPKNINLQFQCCRRILLTVQNT